MTEKKAVQPDLKFGQCEGDQVLVGVLAEYVAMFANLTAVQKRCTELLEENRRLKRKLAKR